MRKKIATVARPFDGNVQVERLKRLMVDAIERKGRSYQLRHIGLHSMAWNPQLNIGRKIGPPWSRYQLYYFQLGFCRHCGLAKQRWIGEAPKE